MLASALWPAQTAPNRAQAPHGLAHETPPGAPTAHICPRPDPLPASRKCIESVSSALGTSATPEKALCM